MKNRYFDIVIVGTGLVGLATAHSIIKDFKDLRLAIIEKEKEICIHQSKRNSGVIHSGLYYKPGSERAINCTIGREMLTKYCKDNKVEHDICGKIVVATNKNEIESLYKLKLNGKQNGLSGIKMINKKAIKKVEPYVDGIEALFVPQSGIINYRSLAISLFQKIIKNKNVTILTDCKVQKIDKDCVDTSLGKLKYKYSIFCGGLHSDRLAKLDKIYTKSKIVTFRGDFFRLNKNVKNKIKNLVYPVPNPKFPFLGIHFTRMMDGTIECGPNAVFTFKREDYLKNEFSFNDAFDALSFKGTWKLFLKNWKFGLDEYKRAFSKKIFLKEINKLVPSICENDFKYCRSGVRAILLKKDGSIEEDFVFEKNNNNLHVLNAPSPAATACLSIGDKIKSKLFEC
ncbi:L-2-hydroxyglutarate oxidase [Bacteroidota bacterium]|nr:L-2-hydroxyglutarate oxidase [Bacteroidota bacterium]